MTKVVNCRDLGFDCEGVVRAESAEEALHGAGITRNARTERLATLPHITPDYIYAHRLALERSGKG